MLQLQERDTRLRARYGESVRVAAGSSLLVSPTGRPITRPPEGWGVVGRLSIPEGGGAVALPSGASAIAEPVDRAGEVYLVRAPKRLPAQPAAANPEIRLAVLGRDRAVLEAGGRRIELRRRLAEILVLLSAHPEGLSAESLCAHLHGDGGSPSSVRVEVSRLRKVLGPGALDTDRYRLTCGLESDARRVASLLQRGHVREAAEAYTGPLLPESEAPGVVEERERLEVLAAPGGDDRRRRRGAVGVGAHRPRHRGPPGVEAPALAAGVHRPAPRAGCLPPGRAPPRAGWRSANVDFAGLSVGSPRPRAALV